MALAAHSERHYDSDGSDDYHVAADARSLITGPDAAVATPARVTTSGFAASGAQTPVVDPPPWSQRAASYPPWSQRSAGALASRAATLPFWSQMSNEVASARLLERRAANGHSPGEVRGEDQAEEEDEQERGAESLLLSQLSSRSSPSVPRARCYNSLLCLDHHHE